jgi:STE24 endopeptidase
MLRRIAFSVCLLLPIAAHAAETPAEHAANVYAANEMAAAPVHSNLPDYSLPPDKLTQAQHLVSIRETLHFGTEAWGIVTLLLLLWFGVIGWMRDTALPLGNQGFLQAIMFPYSFVTLTLLIDCLPALLVYFALPVGMKAKLVVEALILFGSASIMWSFRRPLRASTFRWVQGYSFLLLFTLANFIVGLPIELYDQHMQLKYGFSVQRWLSYFGDDAKSLGLAWIFGGLVLMLLFWIIRKFPRRWWLVFWCTSIPITLFSVFVGPYINLLYNKFEPLQLHNPELVARLEQVVQKGHMNIPPDRMFLMKASEKVTTLNAYVTGFGSSKRVVVWDTSLQKGTPDEVLFIFGHESGHYVLGHIVIGVLVSILSLLGLLFLGYHFVQWAIRRFGTRWKVPAQADWAAFAVLWLAFSIFSALLEPAQAAFSRHDEHAADVYGQEAIHGLVADPQTVAKDAFDVLGTNSLSDPNPNPLYEFWTFDHPAIGRRAAFSKAYNPWAPGYEPKYFKK